MHYVLMRIYRPLIDAVQSFSLNMVCKSKLLLCCLTLFGLTLLYLDVYTDTSKENTSLGQFMEHIVDRKKLVPTVTGKDFENALSTARSSVSAQDLAHYESLRKQFGG